MKPRSVCASPALAALRAVSAVLLAILVGVLVEASPRAAVAAQPPKKDPSKKEPDKKELDKKEPTKTPEIKWPTEINGRNINDVMKEMESPDPAIREVAVRALPLFGPPTQKDPVSKALLHRMRIEPDPGVKLAVIGTIGQVQFEHKDDTKEAMRLLGDIIDRGASGGMGRLHAVQTVAMFGPKGAPCITALTGVAMNDAAYETRRTIAQTLGRVGYDEKTGPNLKALTALADRLARDPSAAVRMEAYQSLMLLGPPWDGVMKEGAKEPPPIDIKAAETILKFVKVRVGDPKTKTEGKEKNKEVEIWARLVLIRLDEKELNDDNLDALAHCLSGSESGVRIQALQAMAILREKAAKKLTDVIRVLEEKEAPVGLTVVTIQTMIAMGASAKPALPNLKKLLEAKKKEFEAKKKEFEAKKAELDKKIDDPKLSNEAAKLYNEAATLDELVHWIEAGIKHIEEAKFVSPAAVSPDPPKKP